MTRCGTCVPPGPSKNTAGWPFTVWASEGNCERMEAKSSAGRVSVEFMPEEFQSNSYATPIIIWQMHTSTLLGTRRRIAIIIAAVVLAVLAAWLIYSKRSARAQIKRDAVYQAQLAQYKRDLRLGMSRSEVEAYLRARKIPYNEINGDYDAKVGEDPSNSIFCEKWDVYIQMNFVQALRQTESSPSDKLESIFIQRAGICI